MKVDIQVQHATETLDQGYCTGMRWKNGWKVHATLTKSSMQANQKRHFCFNGYLQVSPT
jgi:hypothetical protein